MKCNKIRKHHIRGGVYDFLVKSEAYREQWSNPLLSVRTEDRFIDLVTGRLPITFSIRYKTVPLPNSFRILPTLKPKPFRDEPTSKTSWDQDAHVRCRSKTRVANVQLINGFFNQHGHIALLYFRGVQDVFTETMGYRPFGSVEFSRKTSARATAGADGGFTEIIVFSFFFNVWFSSVQCDAFPNSITGNAEYVCRARHDMSNQTGITRTHYATRKTKEKSFRKQRHASLGFD